MMVSAEFFGGPWDGRRLDLTEAPERLFARGKAIEWLGTVQPAPLSLEREVVYRRMPTRRGPVRYVLEKVAR